MQHVWHKDFLCISILFYYMLCLWDNEAEFIYKYWVQIYRFFFLNIFTSQQYRKCEKHCSEYIFGRYLVPVWTNCRLSWLRLLQCSSLFTCEFHINIGHDCLSPNCYLFINMKIFPSDLMLYYYYSWSSTILWTGCLDH